MNRIPCRRIGLSLSPRSEAALQATLEFERCNESAEAFTVLADLNIVVSDK